MTCSISDTFKRCFTLVCCAPFFALTPLANLHIVLICAAFFVLTPVGWLHTVCSTNPAMTHPIERYVCVEEGGDMKLNY